MIAIVPYTLIRLYRPVLIHRSDFFTRLLGGDPPVRIIHI